MLATTSTGAGVLTVPVEPNVVAAPLDAELNEMVGSTVATVLIRVADEIGAIGAIDATGAYDATGTKRV